MKLDRASLLLDVSADALLGDIEDALARDGLTLGVAIDPARTVGDWLSQGAPGAPDPWLDPADHLLAGLDATLPDGTLLSIPPAPRRSTGPDLIALAFGMRDRFVTITRAWLRVHPRDTPRPETEAFRAEHNPAVSAGEERLLAAIARELQTSYASRR